MNTYILQHIALIWYSNITAEDNISYTTQTEVPTPLSLTISGDGVQQ